MYWYYYSFLLCFSLQWSLAHCAHCTTLKSLCTALELFYTHMQGTTNSSGSCLVKKGFVRLLWPPCRHTLVAGAQSGQDRVFQITLLPIGNTFKPLLATSSAYFKNEGLPNKWIVFCLWEGYICVKWVVRHFGRFYLPLLVGCLSLWMGNFLPLSMVRYPVCPCDRIVLVIGTSILVTEIAIIASNLFIWVDCLPLWVGCLSVSVVVCPYEWIVCPREWVVHICEWDVHPCACLNCLSWVGSPCLWVHACEWVVCLCEWVVCLCELVVCPCASVPVFGLSVPLSGLSVLWVGCLLPWVGCLPLWVGSVPVCSLSMWVCCLFL